MYLKDLSEIRIKDQLLFLFQKQRHSCSRAVPGIATHPHLSEALDFFLGLCVQLLYVLLWMGS